MRITWKAKKTRTPDYTDQLYNWDCVPAALANALKWAGKNISYKQSWEMLFKACNCREVIGGATIWDTNNAFARIGKDLFSTTVLFNPEVEEVENHLSGKGAGVISFLLYAKKEEERILTAREDEEGAFLARHVVFTPGKTPNQDAFQIVHRGHIIDLPRYRFRRHFDIKKENNPNVVYLLSKERKSWGIW